MFIFVWKNNNHTIVCPWLRGGLFLHKTYVISVVTIAIKLAGAANDVFVLIGKSTWVLRPLSPKTSTTCN
jgi:hypothetical protein